MQQQVSKLIYNLAFDSGVRQKLAELDFPATLEQNFIELNHQLLDKYKDEYNANDSLQQKLSKIVKNHAKHANDDAIKEIIK